MPGYRFAFLVSFLCSLGGEALLAEEKRPVPGKTAPAAERSSRYFSRGFDLEQGPDFAVSVDGIPLNLPSAVRAPGFYNRNLLIAETLGETFYWKGPYDPGQGPFAVAGSAELRPVDAFERPMAKAVYGGAVTDRFGSLLWADTRTGGNNRVTYALEATRSDRPWNQLEESSCLNAFLRVTPKEPGRGWNVTLLATGDRGDGGSPPPDRPLPPDFPEEDDPRMGDGYHYQRVFLGLNRDFPQSPGIMDHVQLYAGASLMRNWATSTYFLRDPFFGDQLEQVDRRTFLGSRAGRQWDLQLGATQWTHRWGFETRVDDVGDAAVNPSFDRERLGGKAPFLQAWGTLLQGGLYGQSAVRWGQGWQAFAGARVDAQSNQVSGLLPEGVRSRSATLVSPRLGLGYAPWEGLEFRASFGQGFRSGNAFRDSRPLVRAHGADLGVRTRLLAPWESGLTLWVLDLEAEAVFDAGTSALVLGGPSRRQGLEWFNEVKWGPWRGGLNLSWTQARYRQRLAGQDHVPGVIPQAGLLTLGWKVRPLGAKLQFRSEGAYSLNEDNTVVSRRQNALDLRLEHEGRDWTLAMEVGNAFNLRKNKRAYYYPSQLSGEPGGQSYTHTKRAGRQAIRLEVVRRF